MSNAYLEVLGDLTHQTLERKLAEQQFCGLLVLSDFTQSNSSRSESNQEELWIKKKVKSQSNTSRNLCGFLMPPLVGADLRAAFVASCLRGAFPPVDFRAVCFVRAIVVYKFKITDKEKGQIKSYDR